MILRRRWSAGLLSLFALVGPSVSCSGTGPDAIGVAATVQFVEIEGGCWSLLTTSGTRYQPVDLPEEFRIDGLKVVATLQPLEEVSSICMIGEIVEVESIRRLD